jgi:cell shape-determining protein MreC
MTNEVAKLQKENEKLRKKLWQAERIIEVQKKISEILGIEQNLDQNEEDDS